MENEEKIPEVEEVEEIVEQIDDDGNDTTDWKEVALKNQGIAKRLKTKLDKLKDSEKEPKEVKAEAKPEIAPLAKENEELSTSDVLAIVQAGIDNEDIDYIKKYAKLEGVGVSEALKLDDLKEILRVKKEMRKTAEAANITSSRRGSSRPSDESIVSNASKGKLPEDPAELASARLRMKQSK